MSPKRLHRYWIELASRHYLCRFDLLDRMGAVFEETAGMRLTYKADCMSKSIPALGVNRTRDKATCLVNGRLHRKPFFLRSWRE